MAQTLVQSKRGYVDNGTTVAITFDSTPTAGNHVNVCITSYYTAAGAWSVADDKGNPGYTQAIDVSPASGRSAQFFCENIATGAAFKVTFTGTSGQYYLVEIQEWSGTATSGSLDVTAGQFYATNDTAFPSGNTAATAQNDEVAVGLAHIYSTSATVTPGTGYTAIATYNGSGSYHEQYTQYKVLTTTGAQQNDGTLSAASTNKTSLVACFKAAAGGGGPTVPLMDHHYRMQRAR